MGNFQQPKGNILKIRSIKFALASFLCIILTCATVTHSRSPIFIHPTPSLDLSGLESGKGDGANGFSLKGYSFEGGFLVITYSVPYPGLTKVKLFNSSKKMLWRNQYVNEKGDHKLVLKAEKLDAGTSYVFEFDYKAQINQLPVIVP